MGMGLLAVYFLIRANVKTDIEHSPFLLEDIHRMHLVFFA